MSIPPPNPFNLPVRSNEEKERPDSEEVIIDIISPARTIFSNIVLEEQSEYEDNPLPTSPLLEKCRKILEKDFEKAKGLKDAADVAHLVFNGYCDQAIEATLPIFYEKNPSAKQLEKRIREDLRGCGHIMHSIFMEQPILTIVKEKFPEIDLSKTKLDLRKEKEI